MKEEEFNRLFENFSEYDLLSISEIRHILINENEIENKINSFLNTKIEIYAFSHNFRCDVRLMNVLREYFGFYDEKKKKNNFRYYF